jgi:hypothetical protein
MISGAMSSLSKAKQKNNEKCRLKQQEMVDSQGANVRKNGVKC